MFLQTIVSVWLLFLPYFFVSACCTYTSISTRQHQVVFNYGDKRRSERDLPLCGEKSVCNVLYKRYWLPPVAQRFCRCTNNEECPWKWTEIPDNRTMMLNNRSQLKFCAPITNQRRCNPHKTALITDEKRLSSGDLAPVFEIDVKCFCSSEHRWQHFKTLTHISKLSNNTKLTTIREEYKCSELKRCNSREFCGSVRSDYNSIYYSCSCPVQHYCVYKNHTIPNVDELLYKGQAYKAFCEPHQSNEDYNDY